MSGYAANDTIAGRFERQVARSPEAAAIRHEAQTVSYDELNRRTNRLAHAIRVQAEDAGRPVAFLLDDPVDQVVAILALFKAGRIAVPLDATYPAARLRAMVEDSDSGLVLAGPSTRAQCTDIAPGRPVLDLSDLAAFADENPAWPIDPDDWANVFYTSGSTGEPKGVIQTQRNVLRFVDEMADLWRVAPRDCFVQLISCSFSAVLLPILVPLLHGASVMPFDLKRKGGRRLGEVLDRGGVTVLFCVPSVFRAIPDRTTVDDAHSTLRLCVFTGEPLHWADVARLRNRFGPACEAINVLGGSEMHHVASLKIDADTVLGQGLVPAGRPAPGKEILLVDDRGAIVPPGETGHLVVRGRHLSPGYWQRPDLTRAAFSDAPEPGGMRSYRSGDLGRFTGDGLLEVSGRADSRVKLRGQMVETAAVESSLASCPGIAEAAVCVLRGSAGNDRLVAFVATERGEDVDWTALGERLAHSLPAFMVPYSYRRLPSLPRAPGGKIDRACLVRLAGKAADAKHVYTAPRDDRERHIAAAVEKVLGVHPVGVEDDLFDIGLDSLHYADLLVALEEVLGRRLPEETLLHARTVARLAMHGPDQPDPDQPPPGDESTAPGGGQSYGKSWARLDREMRARYVAARVIGLLPFRWSFGVLRRLCRSRRFRNTPPVSGRAAHAGEFLESLPASVDLEKAIARSLVCNYAQPWLLGALSRIPGERVNVQGLEHFERARASGPVILAVSHFGIQHADLLALDRNGQDGIVTIGSFEYELKLLGLDHLPHVPLTVEPGKNFLFRSQFIRRAREVLESGGVVRVAADGLHGTGGRVWRFLGRDMWFRPGLGELAVQTGAPVVPVFGVLGEDGGLNVEFLPALSAPSHDLTRADAVDAVMGQYVRLLEERWTIDPGSVVWEIVPSFLEAPETETR